MRECVDGVSGAVLLTGAGGSGKSLVARHAVERLRSAGAVVLTARGRREERSRALSTLNRLLAERPTGDRLADPPTSAEAGRAALVAIGARHPLVVVLDDAHHTDPTSTAVLSRLVGEAPVPVGLLLTGGARVARTIPPGCRSLRVELGPLTRAEVAELVHRSDTHRRGRWFVHACHEISGGNARLTTALVADDRREPDPGRVTLGRHYRAALRHALDRAPSTRQEVATALAVAEADASPALLARLTGLEPASLGWCMDGLRELGVLRGDRFRHPGIAELLLGWADPWELVCLHRRAVEFLGETGGEPASVERHEDAAQVLAGRTSAARAAAASGAPVGLDAAVGPPAPVGAAAAVGPDVRVAAGHQAERAFSTIVSRGPSMVAVARLEQVLHQLEPEPATIATIGTALSGIVYSDQAARARYWCDRLLDRIPNTGRGLWAQIVAVRAEAALRQGDLGAALADAAAALRDGSVDATAPVPGALAAYVLAGTWLGRHREVAGKLRETRPDEVLQSRATLLYLNARGHHHRTVGEPTAALDDFLTCGELATDGNVDQPGFVPWRSGAAQAFLALGDTDRARQLLEEQLALVGGGRSRGITRRLLALTLDREQRCALLGQAVDDLQADPDRYELALARHDLDAARSESGGPHPGSRRSATAGAALSINATPTTAADPAPSLVVLSRAERRVADLAADGHTNQAISDQLWITVSTVEQHLTRVYRKLHIHRRDELRRFAHRRPPTERAAPPARRPVR